MAHRFALRPVALGASVFSLVLALSIAGCGGGGGGSATPPAPPVPPPAGDGGGTAKILSAAKMINIGGSSIGAGTTGQPVSVAGDIVIPYTPGDITATGVFTGTCGGLAFTTTIKSSAPGTTTFAHAPWAHSVNCTGSVTFSFAGYTSATENYSWRTEDAPPPPAKLSYSDIVMGILPTYNVGTNGTVRIDRTVNGGLVPNVNLTNKNFYFVGLRRTPRADCLVEASALDSITGLEYKLLWNPKTGEYTLDTSAAGALWDRFRDYAFTALDADFDAVRNRLITARVANGEYFLLNQSNQDVWFTSTQGVTTKVATAAIGSFNWIGSYSCTAQ